METLAPFLLVALVVAGALSVFLLVCVQPIWSIVEVATSKKHSGGVKATVIILTLVLLGPFMTIGYALFGTHSKPLRRFTLISFTVLVVSGLATMGLALAVPAIQGAITQVASGNFSPSVLAVATAGSESDEPAEVAPEPFTGRVTTTYPATLAASFTAVHVVPTQEPGWEMSIAKFSSLGPSTRERIPLVQPSIYPINQVAVDYSGPSLYALTILELGKINPATGELVELEADAVIAKPTRPTAIAFDTDRGVLLISAKSSGYSYNPATKEWKVLPGLKDNRFVALEYDSNKGVVYALQSKPEGGAITKLITMSPDGVLLKQTELPLPIPIGADPYPMAQLCQAGEQLIVVVSPVKYSETTSLNQPKLFSVDPTTGICLPVETRLAASIEANEG